MIRLLSLFTGIGAFEKALKNLNIPYELVAFSEIDKYAIKSYCNIHNETEEKNLGDVRNINTDDIPKTVDIMTWGFPCQDISLAGKLRGIEYGETRSGLYYEGYRILKEVMPQISIIENVKNLTSKRFKEKFLTILKDIKDLGYNNYYKVLNAKDYGIPQNRERVFIISVRKDIDKCSFNFPKKQILRLRLKDLLEESVEEKYYLSEKAIGRLIKRSNKMIREQENPNVSACLVANYYKLGARDQQYIKTPNVKRIAGMFDEENKHYQAGGIYDDNGISPTLTRASGGHVQPHILVREGTQKGTTEATEGDSINVSYPMNTNRRGRVGKQISQTILASNNNIATIEKADGTNSSAAVLITEDGDSYFKIRRLTPKECWRLMRIFR